jgi:hypothetical protein
MSNADQQTAQSFSLTFERVSPIFRTQIRLELHSILGPQQPATTLIAFSLVVNDVQTQECTRMVGIAFLSMSTAEQNAINEKKTTFLRATIRSGWDPPGTEPKMRPRDGRKMGTHSRDRRVHTFEQLSLSHDELKTEIARQKFPKNHPFHFFMDGKQSEFFMPKWCRTIGVGARIIFGPSLALCHATVRNKTYEMPHVNKIPTRHSVVTGFPAHETCQNECCGLLAQGLSCYSWLCSKIARQ